MGDLSLWEYGALMSQWAIKHPRAGADDGAPEPTAEQFAAQRANLRRLGVLG